jgi:hypothetical protein
MKANIEKIVQVLTINGSRFMGKKYFQCKVVLDKNCSSKN